MRVRFCRYKRDSWQIWENYAQVAQQAGFPLQATRALGQVSARARVQAFAFGLSAGLQATPGASQVRFEGTGRASSRQQLVSAHYFCMTHSLNTRRSAGPGAQHISTLHVSSHPVVKDRPLLSPSSMVCPPPTAFPALGCCSMRRKGSK